MIVLLIFSSVQDAISVITSGRCMRLFRIEISSLHLKPRFAHGRPAGSIHETSCSGCIFKCILQIKISRCSRFLYTPIGWILKLYSISCILICRRCYTIPYGGLVNTVLIILTLKHHSIVLMSLHWPVDLQIADYNFHKSKARLTRAADTSRLSLKLYTD
jgi:hypothetical protein